MNAAPNPSREIVLELQREFMERQQRNPAYSLRSFASFLGLTPAAISQILNGKRSVTRQSGAKILARLPKLSDKAPFLLAELRGRGPTSTVANGKKADSFSQLEAQAFKTVSDWYYYAILSLSETKGFKSDAQWIADRLGLKLALTKRAIETLVSLEMLKRDSRGQLSATGAQFTSTHDIANLALQRAHLQGLELARQSIAKHSVDERDFSYMVMAADVSRLPQAKKMIRDFRRKLTSFLEGGASKTEVLRLSVQLFPLSQKGMK